jgi:hypothetical protein
MVFKVCQGMEADSRVEIVDAVENPKYEGYLYRCLFHSRKDEYGNHFRSRRSAFHDHRREYLKRAIPKGFHKKEFRMQAQKGEKVYIEGNLEEVVTPKDSFYQITLTYCPIYYEQALKVVP